MESQNDTSSASPLAYARVALQDNDVYSFGGEER